MHPEHSAVLDPLSTFDIVAIASFIIMLFGIVYYLLFIQEDDLDTSDSKNDQDL